MPIPKPEKTEKMTEYLNRCMGDEVMVNEYPNERQRMAVCAKEWRNATSN
jgi:hypothetical protein